MKLSLFAVLFATSVSLFAAPLQKPLISKHSGGGFIHPDYAGGERCDLYSNRVLITHQNGINVPTATKLTEERKISLQGNMAAIIELAKTEKIVKKDNMLCDGPSTSIVANAANGEEVLLYSTGGCGTPSQTREGLASSKLTDLINVFCPKTYDFSVTE